MPVVVLRSMASEVAATLPAAQLTELLTRDDLRLLTEMQVPSGGPATPRYLPLSLDPNARTSQCDHDRLHCSIADSMRGFSTAP